jgi:hypothetical protein
VAKKRTDGYLTVFLALSMTVILSLFFVLLEGARMNAIRMQIELAGDNAVNSVLGEYHRELARQYDLFFVDESYGTASPSETNVREHLLRYLEQNYSRSSLFSFGQVRTFTGLRTDTLEITGTRCAADNDAEALRQQVYAYMSADPLGNISAGLLAEVDRFNGLGLDSGEWQRKKAENEAEFENILSGSEETGDKQAGGMPIDQLLKGIRQIDDFFANLTLDRVVGLSAGISDAETDPDNLLSHRAIHTGTALEPANTHGYSRADSIVFDEYILEKCNTWKHKVKDGKLKYQAEYILCGQGADRQNLGRMVERILLVREAANAFYLFSDAAKSAEAGALATAVCTALFQPEAAECLKAAILFDWAWTESLKDAKTLMAGGRIPLVKDGSSWKTSMLSIFVPDFATSGETGGSGLNYRDYLRIFLYLENGSMKNMRLMDIMEADIRETDGNENFRMDWCMDAFGISSVTKSSFGYSYPLKREVSYN